MGRDIQSRQQPIGKGGDKLKASEYLSQIVGEGSLASKMSATSEGFSLKTGTITIYVDGLLGNDANDGLTSGTGAKKTIQAAFNAIYMFTAMTHNIDITAGTYTEKVAFTGRGYKTQVNVVGKKTVLGVPTVIVDCDGLAGNGFDISFPALDIRFTDIEVKNALVGFNISYGVYAQLDNCYGSLNTTADLYAAQDATVIAGETTGCKFTSTSSYNCIAYHAFMSILNTEITGATIYGAYWATNSGGHCDNNNIHDCYIGIAARHGSSPTIEAVGGVYGSITDCTYAGVLSEDNSTVFCAAWGSITMTGNATNFAEYKGSRQILQFYQDNVAANQSDVVLMFGGANGYILAPFRGSIVGISVVSNAARSAGTLVVEAYAGTTATGLKATLDGTNTTFHYATQQVKLDNFSEGSLLSAQITTSADWAPTTADIAVTLWIET